MAKPSRYQRFKGEPNVRRSTLRLPVAALASFVAFLILAVSRLAGATTINANSASESDVGHGADGVGRHGDGGAPPPA